MGRIARGQTPAAAATPPEPPPGPVASGVLEALLLGTPVSEQTRLNTGDRVIVEWNGTWWAGEVLTVNPGGTVRIHYTGWPTQSDETVTRARLQVPGEARKLVTIHFNPN